MAEPTIRDPDASAGDRARWVVGDLGWVAGGLGGIAAVVLGLLALFGVVGGSTALWALAVTVAGLAVGQVAHRDAAPPVLRRSDLVVAVEESEAKSAAGPVGDLVAAHNDLADALLAGVTALPEPTDPSLLEVVEAARRVAHLAAVDLHESVAVIGAAAEEAERGIAGLAGVLQAHDRARAAVDELAVLAAALGPGHDERQARHDRAIAELGTLTEWVAHRQDALRGLDPTGDRARPDTDGPDGAPGEGTAGTA